jgi:hypothetical protein
MVNPLILLVLLSVGLLISSVIIGIIGIIKDFKKKNQHQFFIFIIFVFISMILLIPVIFGLLQDLNL